MAGHSLQVLHSAAGTTAICWILAGANGIQSRVGEQVLGPRLAALHPTSTRYHDRVLYRGVMGMDEVFGGNVNGKNGNGGTATEEGTR